jgi:hypothetical protein
MIYVFDTSSLRALQHFYPRVFTTIWTGLDSLVEDGRLISTREVYKELEAQAVSDEVKAWAKSNKAMFTTPGSDETLFVATIFQNKHFQSLIGEQQRLKGNPVADPFVIACAKIRNGTVVTEEGWSRTGAPLTPKPNAAKIPNVCKHFNVPCANLEAFMQQQGWKF